MKIVILEPLGLPEKEVVSTFRNILGEGHELIIHNDRVDDIEKLKERAAGADVLVIANMPLKGEVIRSVDNLKLISVAFTGVDHVDLEACKERNILVCNSAGYSTSSVAELAFGLILSLLRNIVPLDEKTREGKTKDGYSQRDLCGKTLGIVGAGAIGLEVARIGKAFGCNVIAYNRSAKSSLKELDIKQTTLDEVLSQSDVVSIHVPLNENTKGLISKEKISLMKESSILINTARGPIIDNEALAEALREGRIAGAGIDVFDMEPPLPLDYSLLHAPNAVVAPHVGFATKEAMIRRAKIVFENILKWLEGNPQNIMSK
ncbi:2-hydroxyacid dehydrogenase [uncultured Clostridium sp.]|uniref:2-hydroxyacid dehydrogenase n=1 Tax=uncultured Clostridium sp. TaxID=59620 RepID=UPI0028EF4E38|nr:2-hydroxyacid dehydrogenase [uncultured Clostridium sp.]